MKTLFNVIGRCLRCNGRLNYVLREEDGFQFLERICECATDRVIIHNREDIQHPNSIMYRLLRHCHLGRSFGYEPEEEFLSQEEMRL